MGISVLFNNKATESLVRNILNLNSEARKILVNSSNLLEFDIRNISFFISNLE